VSTREQPAPLTTQPAPLASQPEAVDERQRAVVRGLRGSAIQPRLVVGLALIAAGLLWAILRGLEYYGLSPIHLAYDLDQPPLLLVLVGTWLLYRSRPR
jgi:hypothetical protein